ncbi:dual specificity protein kinase yak1 [Rhodotorula toruloides]
MRPISSLFFPSTPSHANHTSSDPLLIPLTHDTSNSAHTDWVTVPIHASTHTDSHAHPSQPPASALPLATHNPPPPSSSQHARSLSLSRYARAGHDSYDSLSTSPSTHSSFRSSTLLEQGLPPPPSFVDHLASQQQGHRQTRSVGRVPSISSVSSHASTSQAHSSTTSANPHPPPPPPPQTSAAHRSRNPSFSTPARQPSMLASDAGVSSVSQQRQRAVSNSSRSMVYSPLPPQTATSDSGAGGVGQFIRLSPGAASLASGSGGSGESSTVPGGQADAASAGAAMRRGFSYDGGSGVSSSAGGGLLPGSYASSSSGGRALYSPMTGVQSTGPPSSSASTSASSPSRQAMLPTAPSPSRAYSPSHYAASPASASSFVPPHHAPPPPNASSFYPQHIAQSYPSAGQSTSPNPLSPGSASSAGHPHLHGHSHSFSGTPSTSTSTHTQGHDIRHLSLSRPAPAPAQTQQRKKKGMVRVREGEEVERAGTTRGGQPRGRRADPAGGFVSPLKALTVSLSETYHLVNPAFTYETSRNPRRVLTKPSKPAQNDGFDNEDSDYILYVNDVLGPEDKDRYLILDVLGQGTFGQVVKCQNMKTHEIVAVKVVKNKPAYFQQSMMEVTILELINNQWDKDDEHHMLRLKDTFIHHSHLCLVFELLSNNLYELIKQNSFRGLSTSLVRVFTAQLLDALSVLNEAKIIHCDLKPENILLKSLQSPTIKVIDFGSACHEKQTVYTYIQSRFYRSPEVILSLPYSSMIDMWSLGCICVELFLGLPLFPGTSEFNQITRIVEMLGMPPDHMLDKGKQTSHFFESFSDEYGRRRWRLKSLERYAQEYKANEQPSKKYFSASTLPEIVKQYPIVRKGLKEADIDKEMRNRIAFIDFVQGLLHLDPEQRWTPQQARLHPFVLGEPLLAPFVPPPRHLVAKGGAPSPTEVAAAKQQQQVQAAAAAQAQAQAQARQQTYGGMQPGARQVQQARPYLPQQQPQPPGYGLQPQQQPQQRAQAGSSAYAMPGDAQAQQAAAQAYAQAQARSLYGAAAGGFAPRTAPAGGAGPTPSTVANPPAVHHQYGAGRQRSGTHGAHDAALPPALQKLGYELGAGLGAGQSITPVLRRDDQWQAWEQQYGPGATGLSRRISVSGRHPHLNLLQEQAEAGFHSWNSPARAKPQQQQPQQSPYAPAAAGGYYASPHQPSTSQFSVVVDPAQDKQRPGSDLFDPVGGIAPPPLAYVGGNSAARYAPYPSAAAGGSGAPLPPSGTAMPLSTSIDHHHPASHHHSPIVPPSFDAFGTPISSASQPNPLMHGHDPLSHYQPLQPYASPNLSRTAQQGAGPAPPQPGQQGAMYSPGGPYGGQPGGKPPRGLW